MRFVFNYFVIHFVIYFAIHFVIKTIVNFVAHFVLHESSTLSLLLISFVQKLNISVFRNYYGGDKLS